MKPHITAEGESRLMHICLLAGENHWEQEVKGGLSSFKVFLNERNFLEAVIGAFQYPQEWFCFGIDPSNVLKSLELAEDENPYVAWPTVVLFIGNSVKILSGASGIVQISFPLGIFCLEAYKYFKLSPKVRLGLAFSHNVEFAARFRAAWEDLLTKIRV